MTTPKKYQTGLHPADPASHLAIDESLLAAALYFAEDAILITTATANRTENGVQIVYINPAFTRLTGYPPQEIIGRTLHFFCGEKTDRAIFAEFEAHLSAGKVFRGATTTYRKDGSEFMNEWHAEPIKDSNENITHFLAVHCDITERKQKEAELLEQRNNFERRHASLLEILGLYEIEKKNIKKNVTGDDQTLGNLTLNRTERQAKSKKIIKQHMQEITAVFKPQAIRPHHRLSPREAEIADLVKQGLSSRDIAGNLTISIKTVETIRNKIRRKLGLVNKTINMTSYFRNT